MVGGLEVLAPLINPFFIVIVVSEGLKLQVSPFLFVLKPEEATQLYSMLDWDGI